MNTDAFMPKKEMFSRTLKAVSLQSLVNDPLSRMKEEVAGEEWTLL